MIDENDDVAKNEYFAQFIKKTSFVFFKLYIIIALYTL